MTNPVLRGISDAAKGISAERQRLNETFEALRATARTFDPNAVLQDDGTITVDGKQLPDAFVPTPARAAIKEEAAASVRLDKDEEAQTVAIPPQRQQNGKRSAQKAVLKAYFYEHPSVRITVGAAASIISDETEAALHMLRALCSEDIVERDSDAYYHLSEVERRKADPPPSAATQPASPPPREPQLAAQPSKPAPGSQATAPAAQVERAVPSDEAAEKIRSPKPWSEMKDQQRDAERRLAIVYNWIEDHEGNFDPLTIREELGDVFSNKMQSAGDLKILETRGLIERTGNMIHPPFKRTPEWESKPKGRTTVEYRLPKA